MTKTTQPSVVIVSPYFPPAALAGVHRARHLAKHLPAAGWNPIILCVEERYHEQVGDPALAALVPHSVRIEKVAAVPIRYTRPFGLGEISLRAFVPLRRAALRAAARPDVRAVIITGSPYYPMLLAPALCRLGVAVILDFQDPWVSSWGAAQSRASKAGISHWLATKLEPIAVRSASFITSVSDRQNEEMRKRYPERRLEEFEAIPIGGDPEDFTAEEVLQPASTSGLVAPEKFNLSFVGTFMPRSGPLMRLVFEGVKLFRRLDPHLAGGLRLNFIGTGNHASAKDAPVTALAREFGVSDIVFEIPERIGYVRAIAMLAQSDAVLLVGSDEPHYTASKIYPGLMCGRPYISLFHVASSSHEILRRAGGGLTLGIDPAIPGEVPAQIAAGLKRLLTEKMPFGRANPEAYASFTAAAVSRQFGAILDRLAGCG